MTKISSLVSVALSLLLAAAAIAAAETPDAVASMRSALAKGDPEAAIAAGEAATAVPGAGAETWRWLGDAYCSQAMKASLFSRLGFAHKCQAAYERAIALDPTDVESRAALAEYLSGAPSIAGGDKAKARAQAEEVVKLEPARGHLLLGGIYTSEENFTAATAEFKLAVAADPGSRDLSAHYQLGKVALLSGKDLAEGAEHFRAYLDAPPLPGRPTWADAHWRLGLILEKQGHRDQAIAEIRAALKLNPNHPLARKDLERLGG
ncbi:MAG: tetratricopeptide repeat protein [Acidobacteriota bacterium]